MSHNIELGLHTFGDVTKTQTGEEKPQDQVIREVVAEGVLADQVGVDFIGLGEHHRADFAISSPEVMLAAIAAKTEKIRLGTAVTVLSTDDPVRVFQRFSTLHAISNGRAEPIVGRGSFTESYALFGHDMSEYDVLFEEKLDLLTKLIKEQKVSWQGSTRTGLKDQVVYPPLAKAMPLWVGVGGSQESVVRVVRQDVQMMLAIIGGDPARFEPYVDLYKRAVAHFGKEERPIGVHSPGHIAASDEEAMEQAWPAYEEMYGRLGRERGWSPVTKASYLAEVKHGSQYTGSPETVAKKIAKTVKTLGLQRFDLKYATGSQPHEHMMESIRLYGEKVIPMVRDILASDK